MDYDNERMSGGVYPIITRQGGKFSSYKKVIAHFPDNYKELKYVESFVGGGSFFFNKEPSVKEVINDLDPIIYQIYKTVKDDPDDVERRVNGTYNEKDFYKIKDMRPTSNIGIVVRHMLLNKLSFMGTGSIYNTTKKKVRIIDVDYSYYSVRLKHTTILNEDYKKVIATHDSKDTFFYLDPPYENTGKSINEYKDIDLEELRDILSSINGKFLLSINNSARVRALFRPFYITKMKTRYQMKNRSITELLISNYKK